MPGYETRQITSVKSAINSSLFTAGVSSSSVSDTDPVSDSEPLPDFF